MHLNLFCLDLVVVGLLPEVSFILWQTQDDPFFGREGTAFVVVSLAFNPSYPRHIIFRSSLALSLAAAADATRTVRDCCCQLFWPPPPPLSLPLVCQ